ncbi:hypothetical protein JST97_36590 [bacterium]|nr:hypothetical protein [bacterium]
MQANPTERLQRALAQARQVLGGQNPGGKQALRQELAGISQAVEGIMAIWDKMPKQMVDLQSVDANFYSAGETYLDCCEKLNEALDREDASLLNEVEQLLAKAGRQLITANEKAQNELQKLQKPNS